MKEENLKILDRIYFPEIFKGLKITLSYFFRKKVTVQYPEERLTLPTYYRGFPVLNTDELGNPKCVACKLCECVCPSDAIYIEIDEFENQNLRERIPLIFNLNYGRCVNCRFCEEACPVDAIRLIPEYEFSNFQNEDLIKTKETLLELGKKFPKQY